MPEKTLESGTATTLQMSPLPTHEDEEVEESDGDKTDGLTAFGATVHIIRGSIGSGFLLMPFLMKNLGYVTGTAVILTVSLLYYHIVHVLVSTEEQVCRQLKTNKLSYIELAEEVFKMAPFPLNKFRRLSRCCLYILFGIPTANAAYLGLIVDGILVVCKYLGAQPSTFCLISILVVPLTLLCLSRKLLEILVPYSNLTNVCSFLMAFITIGISLTHPAKSAIVQPFESAAYIPESVAICAKTFRFTTLVLSIKHRMNHPPQYTRPFGSVNVAATVITIFYLSFGAILYATYGDQVWDNVLRNLPAQNYLTDCVILLYSLSLSVAYVVICYGRIDNLWSGVVKQKFQHTGYALWAENGFYIGFNALAYLIAVTLTDFAIIAAVTGTMAIPLELALPLIMDLVVRSKNGDLNYWIIAKNLFIIGGSTVLCVLSARNLIQEIIRRIMQ